MGSDRNNLVKLCAFSALLLSAVILLIGVFNINISIGSVQLMGLLSLIKDIALLVAIVFPAYYFAKGTRKKIWVIIFWIAIIVYIVFAILGLF